MHETLYSYYLWLRNEIGWNGWNFIRQGLGTRETAETLQN